VIARVSGLVTPADVFMQLDILLNGDTINVLTIWNVNDDSYGCR